MLFESMFCYSVFLPLRCGLVFWFFVFLSLMVTVVRTAQQAKAVRFLHLAFDTTGDSFLAGDHHGNIYVFNISRNRSDHAPNSIFFYLFIIIFLMIFHNLIPCQIFRDGKCEIIWSTYCHHFDLIFVYTLFFMEVSLLPPICSKRKKTCKCCSF